MALIACRECRGQMADSAEACPHCGAPNTKAAKKKKDSKQAVGCLLVLLAIPIGIFFFPLGVIVGLVGLVIAVVNTRLA